MNEPRYLFITYKECTRGSDDVFYHNNHLTRDQLVDVWSSYLQKNMNLRHFNQERAYEFHIYKSGIKVWECDCPEWDGYYAYDGNLLVFNALEMQKKQDLDEIDIIYKKSQEKALQLQKVQEEAEEVRKSELLRMEKEARRKQFEKLRQEFIP